MRQQVSDRDPVLREPSRRRRPPERSRILVASADPAVREHVRRSIDKGPREWILCAEHSDTTSAFENLDVLEPDVVVLDVASESTAVRAEGPPLEDFVGRGARRSQVLILGTAGSEPFVARALKAGVKGILSLSDIEDLLESALHAVTRGKPFFSSAATEIVLERFLAGRGGGATQERSPSRKLTRREREVVRLLSEGQSTREIASRLGISVKTAENHRANAMNKLGVRQVSELVRIALQEGIIS